MAQNLTWFQARDLLNAGTPVRRWAWRKWLVSGMVIRYITRVDSGGNVLKYVVPQTEFASQEFLASDWTDEPWVDPITLIPVTPPHTPPTKPPPGNPGGGWGPSGPGGGPSGPGGPLGGGGGIPPGPNPDDPDGPNHPPAGQTPTVTVTISQPSPAEYTDFNLGGNCFNQNGGDGPRSLKEVDVEVTVTGGPPGVGLLSVSLGGQVKLGTGWIGGTQGFSFTSIPYSPGGTLTASAYFTLGGSVYSGSGSLTLPDYCSHCTSSGTTIIASVSGTTPGGMPAPPDVNGTYTCTWDGSRWNGGTVKITCSGAGIYTVVIDAGSNGEVTLTAAMGHTTTYVGTGSNLPWDLNYGLYAAVNLALA